MSKLLFSKSIDLIFGLSSSVSIILIITYMKKLLDADWPRAM